VPSINRIKVDVQRPEELSGWKEEQVYRSPDGTRDAVFHDPFEFHMGADAWKLKIINTISGNTETHRKLESFQYGNSLLHPRSYAPWSGSTLLIANWSPGCCLYDVRKQDLIKISSSGYPVSAIGSPHPTRFVLTTTELSVLLKGSGEDLTKINISFPEQEYPEFRWMRSADCFFAIHRPNKSTSPCISFFDGASGMNLCSIRLDPDELLPYNRSAYKAIQRAAFSLAINKGCHCVGHFLDVWSNAEFNEQSETLSLRVYRPSSSVYDHQGIATCDVEEKWIEVTLNP
jgi:hypothetical protein